MRVTNSMIAADFINRLGENYRESAKVNAQISSGKKFQRFSDDPSAFCQSMALKSTLEKLTRYSSSIDSQVDRLDGSDTALGQANELLQQAMEIAVKGSSGTNNQSDLEIFANQIDYIINAMIQSANQSVGLDRNANIFFMKDGDLNFSSTATAGWKVDAPPAEDILSANLLTDTVDPVPVFWGDPNSNVPSSGSVFAVLGNLKDQLGSGSVDGVSQAIDSLKESIDQVNQLRSSVGVKTNHLESIKSFMEDQILSLNESISNLVGVDIEKAVLELKQNQTAYEATMAAGARLMQTSLLDYLK